MKFRVFLLAVALVFSGGIAFAQEEQEEITLTTYYPCPYGEYDQLYTAGNTYLAAQGGDVGIGTTGPSAKLHLESTGADDVHLHIGATGTGQAGLYIDASDGDFSGSDYMGIYQSDNLKGHINMGRFGGALILQEDGGNVGIGTTSPQAKLHVSGEAGNDGIMFPDGTLQTTAARGKVYDSGWFEISANTSSPPITHNLGTTKCLVTVMAATDSSGAHANANVETSYRTDPSYGFATYDLTPTTIRLQVFNNPRVWVGTVKETATHARIIMMALE